MHYRTSEAGLVESDETGVEGEADVSLFGRLQVALVAALGHGFVALGADGLPRAVMVAVRKLDFDHCGHRLEEIRPERWMKAGWLASYLGVIKGSLIESGCLADVSFVVLREVGFNICCGDGVKTG